jgi:hypothetical protein
MTNQNFTTFAAHFMKKHLILKCRQVEKGKTVKSERFKGFNIEDEDFYSKIFLQVIDRVGNS